MKHFKKKLTTFAAMLTLVSITGMQCVEASGIADNTVLGKTNNMDVYTNGNTQNIVNTSKTNGTVGQVDFAKFNVGENETVNFQFSGLSQTIINRILGGSASEILGKITSGCIAGSDCSSFASTGKVLLINPSGILFGQGSSVDLNSFTISTFDFNGAKNIGGLTSKELENYQNNTLNKMSPNENINGTKGKNYGDITLDSNYTKAFEDARTTYKKANGGKSIYNAGKTYVNFDGTTFNDLHSKDGINHNKSVAVISDNVSYIDSVIRTGDNGNYENGNNSLGNVSIVTADGITFRYGINGFIGAKAVAADTKTNVQRNITMNNSGLDATKEGIRSGDVDIINLSNKSGSNINISNMIVKGTKLIDPYYSNGAVYIVGSNDVNVNNARIESINTKVTSGSTTKDTTGYNGGDITISAGKNLSVKDSLIASAGTKANTTDGKVNLTAGNSASLDNTRVLSKGDLNLTASKVNVANKSLLQAKNTVDTSKTKNVTVKATDSINIDNSIVDATKDINILAVNRTKTSGNIVISSDYDKQNNSALIATGTLNIKGNNTTIDDTSLAYNTLSFYGNGYSGTNNVTISGNSAFVQKSGAVNIETNGNLTFDAAKTGKVSNLGYTLATDNGKASGYKYTLATSNGTIKNLNATSTTGNVTFQNGTNIKVSNDITANAAKAINVNNSTLDATSAGTVNLTAKTDFNAQKSTIKAKKDVNINADGTVKLTSVKNGTKYEGSTITADNDVNITSGKDIVFGADGSSSAYIQKSNKISAGNNINFNSKGDINAEKTTMTDLAYENKLTFNATGSNNFTSNDSLKAVNVDFIAGKTNNITTKGDIQLVNTTLKAPTNNIKTTQEGGDVILNNVTLAQATKDAKNTVTNISAKGNVTTKEVVKTTTTGTKHFPQSVNYTGSVVQDTAKYTALDVSKTKLKINTETKLTTPVNDDQGSVTLTLKNANNKDAGLEVVAKNPKWDGQIEAKQGPEVHLFTTDGELSIANIYTDKLTLNASKDHYLSATDSPNGIATITVKDQGGFNEDPNEEYDPEPKNFEYDKNYPYGDKKVETERIWNGEEYIYKETDTEIIYRHDYTDKTTTTQTEREHQIHFKNDEAVSFKLVYDKKDVQVDTKDGFVERIEQKQCPPEPPMGQIPDLITIPREQVEISKESTVTDDTVDQTDNVMSAAARIDVTGANEGTMLNFDDDDDE